MVANSLIPTILCGGTGTRLWPLSRASYPKQYLVLEPNNEYSLLQKTQLRLNDLENVGNPILICNEEHRFIVSEQMRSIMIEPMNILLEPFGRNTAPAITIAALKAVESGDDPILLILAADHIIKDDKEFIRVINEGRKYALDNKIVTFGIVPDSPQTGYGYIEAKEKLNFNEIKGVPIAKFIEKPSKNLAEKFILDQRFTWNSGMFLFKASVIISEIQKYAPEILYSCKKAIDKNLVDLNFQRLNQEHFVKCPNLSIDVAVMEKTDVGVVLPLDAGWSDVGNWASLADTSPKDNNGNVEMGNVISKDSKNSYIRSENRLLVGIGLEDMILIETNDVVLAVHKDYVQNIKEIVNQLKADGRSEAQIHKKIYRPWGHYSSIVGGDRWQVKRIEVKPGETLSLQLHHHRAEHWVVVSGTAKVEIDDEISLLSENKSVYIPLGAKHRLSNPGKIPLVLIEVQSGTYLKEDDIVRFKDSYGRSEKLFSKE